MEADFGEKGKKLKVDGGAAVNNLMMQFQSDLFGSNVMKNARNDSIRRCLLSWIGCGLLEKCRRQQQWSIDREFTRNAKRSR
jgi:glycerol kinase